MNEILRSLTIVMSVCGWFCVSVCACVCARSYMIDRVSDPDQYFSVGVSNGSLMTVLPLDREENSWHNLTVVAVETSERTHTHVNLYNF